MGNIFPPLSCHVDAASCLHTAAQFFRALAARQQKEMDEAEAFARQMWPELFLRPPPKDSIDARLRRWLEVHRATTHCAPERLHEVASIYTWGD